MAKFILGALVRHKDFPLGARAHLMMAFGVVCAVFEARNSGLGQVIDAAMVDGVASLTTLIYAMAAQGRWTMDAPGSNFCDGGSHYYDSYETADGKFVAVAPVEPQFYAILVEKLGLDLDQVTNAIGQHWRRLDGSENGSRRKE